MLPLAALACGEALWTAGAERGARELLEGHALWLQRARDGRGAAGREACSRATDASGGFPKTPPRANISEASFLVSYMPLAVSAAAPRKIEPWCICVRAVVLTIRIRAINNRWKL